jgi:hypothetical protein
MPPPTANLQGWFKSDSIVGLNDGDSVLSWPNDASEGSYPTYYLKDTASTNPPTYQTDGFRSLPRVQFAGASSQVLRWIEKDSLADIDMTGWTAATIFVVMKVNNDPALSGFTDSGMYTFGSPDFATHHPYVDGIIYESFCTTSRKPLSDPAPSLASLHVWNVISAASDYRTYLNGSLFSSTGSNTFSGNNTGAWLGRSISVYLDGDIAEILIYDIAVSDIVRASVYEYLNEKWFGVCTIDDTLDVGDLLTKTSQKMIADSEGLSGDAITSIHGSVVQDSVDASDAVSAGKSASITVNDATIWQDAIASLIMKTLADALAINDSASLTRAGNSITQDVSDNMDVSDALTTSLTVPPPPVVPAVPPLSIISTERQFNLDIVLDQRRPHWQLINDILTLYRSAMIYSNGKYKIISDRGDLPVRQVFHSGNMIAERTQVKYGGDLFKPNQANVQFSNVELDYETDVRYVQDSASLFASSEPLKMIDMNFAGIVRPTEAYRTASQQLRRKRENVRQVVWTTNLEGLAAEPGDVAVIGIATTDFEMGFGGKAIDGSYNSLTADREVTVKSGFSYDFYVWHSATDSLESRALANAPGVFIELLPATPFSESVLANDRYAVGISSEDLITVRILSARRDESGLIELTGTEYKPALFDVLCEAKPSDVNRFLSPSQPRSATFTFSNCIICVKAGAAVSSEGGTIAANVSDPFLATFMSVLQSSHNPTANAYITDTIAFVSGAQAGNAYPIRFWAGSSGLRDNIGENMPQWTVAIDGQFDAGVPAIGDQYYISCRTVGIAGLRVELDISAGGFSQFQTVLGNSGCVNVLEVGEQLPVRIIPFAAGNRENRNEGYWTASTFPTIGCGDPEAGIVSNSIRISGQSLQPFYSITLPGSTLMDVNVFGVVINGQITEACSPAGEATDVAFSLQYGSYTVINSMVVPLNYIDSLATIGSLNPFTIDFALTGNGSIGSQYGKMTYSGPSNSGYFTETMAGLSFINATLPQTLAVLVNFRHVDSGGTVHVHDCFGAKFLSADAEITDNTSIAP